MNIDSELKKAAVNEMIGHLLRDNDDGPSIPNDIMAVKLKDALKCLVPTKFKIGDLITPKDKFAPYKHPSEGEIAIVAETYEPRDWKKERHESQVQRDDTLILISDGKRYYFHAVESRYFKKFEI